MLVTALMHTIGQRSESESDHSAGKSDESMEEAEGKEYLLDESELSPSSADEDEAFEDSDDDQTSSQSDSKLTDYEQEPLSPTGVESMAEGDDITMMSLASLQEDLEKGKAAKEQVGEHASLVYIHLCQLMSLILFQHCLMVRWRRGFVYRSW